MKWIPVALLFLVSVAGTKAGLTPEDLISAVDRMSPEQAYTFQQNLEAKVWDPIPEGFFRRMAIDVGASFSALDTVDLSTLTLSGGVMDVDEVNGLDLGQLWRIAGNRFRVGLRLGMWGATDSNLGEDGYSRVDLAGGSLALAAHYQWVRTPSWQVWTEIAPGVGSVTLDIVDTPAGGATTLRSFDGSYAQTELQAGLAWRLNPVINLFLSGGYRLAESVSLEEGGRKSELKFDATGFTGKLGLGINF